MTEAADFESLLRQALSPVEPPAHLTTQLEHALLSITEMAAEELEGWELSAMRDPRNWGRPAAALVLGTGAGAALLLLRARRRPARPRGLNAAAELAARRLREAELQTRRLLRLR
jgi:hypothetical protein